MSVNTKMTAIADAIRAKTGGTAALSLDAMAEAIAGLEIGGLPDGLEALTCGSWTPTSDEKYYTVIHNLGVVPDFLYVVAENPYGLEYNSDKKYMLGYYAAGRFGEGVPKVTAYKASSSSSIYGFDTSIDVDYSSNVTATKYNIQTSYNDRYFKSGMTYKWICGKFSTTT